MSFVRIVMYGNLTVVPPRQIQAHPRALLSRLSALSFCVLLGICTLVVGSKPNWTVLDFLGIPQERGNPPFFPCIF